MDVAYINPFITATRNVFDTMIHVPMMLGKPHLRERTSSSYIVAASIQLTGTVTGSVTLCFPEAVALALVSGLTGEECRSLDADCLDALGEIANMIAGNAKKDFPDSGVGLATPSVTEPKNVKYPDKTPVIVIPCTTGKGRLAIEVALNTPPPTARPAPAAPASETPAESAAPAAAAPAPPATPAAATPPATPAAPPA